MRPKSIYLLRCFYRSNSDELHKSQPLAKKPFEISQNIQLAKLDGWFVHGVTVVISHSRTDAHESEIVCGVHR